MGYAVITGASTGLGKEFARELSKEYKLILIARRKELLIQLKEELNTECILLSYDLSNQDNCFEIVEIVKNYPIDIFINNAGFGKVGTVSLEEELNMIDVNIKASHIFTRAMIDQGCKYILNVTSSAGLLPAGPYMSCYYATKSYMTSFTRGYAYEYPNIYIGCLCPGPIQTEFDQRAGVSSSLNGIDPSYCAKYALKKMKQNKKVIIPTMKMKLAIIFGRFIPQDVLIRLTMHQQKKKIK